MKCMITDFHIFFMENEYSSLVYEVGYTGIGHYMLYLDICMLGNNYLISHYNELLSIKSADVTTLYNNYENKYLIRHK